MEETSNVLYKNKSYEPFGIHQVIQANPHIPNMKLTSLNALKTSRFILATNFRFLFNLGYEVFLKKHCYRHPLSSLEKRKSN